MMRKSLSFMNPASPKPGLNPKPWISLTQRILGTVMGDTFPNHNIKSYYGNPTFYYTGTLDPLG